MHQLKESFAKLLKKPTKTRSDIVSLKHEAQKCNPQISSELAQILKDTSCELDPCKIEKLKKLYNKHFQTLLWQSRIVSKFPKIELSVLSGYEFREL